MNSETNEIGIEDQELILHESVYMETREFLSRSFQYKLSENIIHDLRVRGYCIAKKDEME